MAIIEVRNLTKDYGHRRGVFDVSLCVEKGEVYGFLGPNGAGKTTTIRHLMGFSAPQKGETSILGLDCSKDAATIMQNVGYLPGEIAIPENMTGMEFIRFMQGFRRNKNEAMLKRLLNLFELDPRGKTKRMSLGNKRKLAVITAFMSDPDILLLDEPTSGLDPVMQERFVQFLREEKQRGKTILLSSHIFSEVDAVCDRISIIKDGEIVSTVNADEIKHNENKTYSVAYKNGEKETINILDSEINDLIKTLSARDVASFKEEKFTLEKHFLHFYGKEA